MANAVSKNLTLWAVLLSLLGGQMFSFASLQLLSLDQASAQSRRAPVRKKRAAPPRDSGQDATVVVDGSAVYEAPNFDSPVREYLDRGKKIKISKRIYKGAGGLGAFYKVRLRPRVYGYITDVDINIDGRSGVEVTQDRQEDEIEGDPTRIQEDISQVDPETQYGGSFYLTRFLGLAFSNYNYTEKLNNSKEAANTSLIGVKLTGPGSFMGGLPIDYEVLFTTSAPSFYNDIGSASGFMILSHARASFPLYEANRYYLYYGFGPMLRYSSFDVDLKNQTGPAVDSQEIAIGLDLAAGAAFRLTPKMALRLEGSYTYENETYFGFGGALQFRY